MNDQEVEAVAENRAGAELENPASCDKNEAEKIKKLIEGVHPEVSEKHVTRLKCSLTKYDDILSRDEFEMRLTDLIQHDIDTGQERPVRQALRRTPLVHNQVIDTHIQSMVKQGLIEPSHGEWSSNIVLVLKKDKSYRFCLDYRQLNRVSQKDVYPLPRIDASLDALAGSSWFSTLDLRSGYYQVPMNPIVDGDVPGLLAQHPELEGKTEFQSRREIFDDHILSMILEQTTLFATRDKGVPNFDMKIEKLYKLFAIVLFLGYHHLPSERDYWSTQPDLGVPFVSQMMTRNEYLTFKSYLHFANNNNLEVGNKMAKVAPLYLELNKNVRKFGFFHSRLSIDESIVAYFGKHSAKMFIRMKPVRFGYKIWFLTSSDGYPYAFDIYTGRSVGVPRVLLGFHVVDTLLSCVRELSRPENLTVYFDNFFTSCGLMRHLHEEGFKATETVRKNRTDGANTTLISDKDIEKMPRGSYDYTCDGTACVVKWNDNAVVCLASNSETHLPEQSTNRRVATPSTSWCGR